MKKILIFVSFLIEVYSAEEKSGVPKPNPGAIILKPIVRKAADLKKKTKQFYDKFEKESPDLKNKNAHEKCVKFLIHLMEDANKLKNAKDLLSNPKSNQNYIELCSVIAFVLNGGMWKTTKCPDNNLKSELEAALKTHFSQSAGMYIDRFKRNDDHIKKIEEIRKNSLKKYVSREEDREDDVSRFRRHFI